MRSMIQTNKIKLLAWLIAGTIILTGFSAGLSSQTSYAQRQGVDGAQCVGRNCPDDRGRGGRSGQSGQQGQQPGCGRGDSRVKTIIDFGCNGANKNPIIDMAFALLRFLSFGVGIVVIASIVFAGIQYTTSEGNPEKSAQAKKRVQDSVMALIFYLFIFAIVQYLVPGGLF